MQDVTIGELAARLRASGSVFAEEEAALLLERAHGAELEGLVRRRCAGEPLETVLGWAELAGVRVEVEPGGFVPRRRSELLVRTAIAAIRPGDVVVDLCCGSGAVAAVLARAVPGLEVHGADVDPAAVAVARRNLAASGGHVHEGDLYDALPESLRGRVALIVASPPYVPSAAVALLPAEARQHEPMLALDGGEDGLVVARRVVRGAGEWWGAGGRVVVECSRAQGDALLAEMAAAGLVAEILVDDDLDATVVAGRRPDGS